MNSTDPPKNVILDPQNQRNSKMPVDFQPWRTPRIPEKAACNLFRQGKCWYGGNCKYLHIVQERFISNQPRTEILERMENRVKNYCKWSVEKCPFGQMCYFSHRDNSNRILVNSVHGVAQNKGVCKLRKTQLCLNWLEYGSCRYGGTCRFAHGKEELKQIGSVNSPGLEPNAFVVNLPTTLPRKRKTTGFSYSFWQEKERKKTWFKWDIEKISRIYADWIDLAPVSST